MNPLGTLQGKLGDRVHLRSRTHKRVYDRLWVRGPERRTEAQLRAMAALSSATRAWDRLPSTERELWRSDPPVRTLRRKNRDAKSEYATGWNWFVGAYIVEANTMIFASATGEMGASFYPDEPRTLARIKLPAEHPRNLAVRARVLLTVGEAEGTRTVALTIRGLSETGTELWTEEDTLSVPHGHIVPWACGFKYHSSGNAQVLELNASVQGGVAGGINSLLEVLY